MALMDKVQTNLGHANLQDELNRSMPVANAVGLGDLLQALISHVTTLETQLATLATQLNTNNVTGHPYAPTAAPTAISPIPTK